MAENLDALAKVMYEAVSAEVLTGGGPWAESQHWQIWFHASARAALKYLGLDPENPPEEGGVGKAIGTLKHRLDALCWTCDYGSYPHCLRARGKACGALQDVEVLHTALRALGGCDHNRSFPVKPSGGEG